MEANTYYRDPYRRDHSGSGCWIGRWSAQEEQQVSDVMSCSIWGILNPVQQLYSSPISLLELVRCCYRPFPRWILHLHDFPRQHLYQLHFQCGGLDMRSWAYLQGVFLPGFGQLYLDHRCLPMGQHDQSRNLFL